MPQEIDIYWKDFKAEVSITTQGQSVHKNGIQKLIDSIWLS